MRTARDAGALPVSPHDVDAAAAAIAGRVARTPTCLSQTLSAITGVTVVLKLENLQFTASYKERGALNRLLALSPDERAQGVMAVSAGNFAQAVAHHARQLGVSAKIVMPRNTSPLKVSRTTVLGADVELFGADLFEAEQHAVDVAQREGRVFLSPYDDAAVIAGQGTAALELLEDFADLDALVVPVGGGGLLAGTAVAVRHSFPEIELVGVQAASHPSMVAALRGEPLECGQPTIADGIAVKRPGVLTQQIIRALVDDVVTVEEDAIEEAICLFLEVEKVVAEGAAAAGLAALLEDPERFRGRRVGLIVTGGNIDLRLMASVIMRGLARWGRLGTVEVAVPDNPGAIAALADVIGRTANIVEIAHRRNVLTVPPRAVVVEVTVEARERDDFRRLLDDLEANGYSELALVAPP